ncbi:flagellar attachment zone protein 1-like [Echeneis naucrates]|uniref:flagellar attachment zone protein 1-like n=1 Tax=Echeneis naucrates TaxID=173247 RepID=UPI0011138C36|nr:flagellar attachment zone protein 1-like [Echeneis naucrates]
MNSITQLIQQTGHMQSFDREEHMRHLSQDVVGLRAAQESLKRTLAVKKKHTQQLIQDNTQLKESLTSLQSKFEMSECMLSDITESLGQTKSILNAERQQKQQIQDHLRHGNKEVERLQQGLTHARRTTEKKLLQKEKDLEKLHQERDALRAEMEDQSTECVQLTHTKERLEADLAWSHKTLHTSSPEVQSRDQLILQLSNEKKTVEQKFERAQEQVTALEGEVKRLNHRVREHPEEAFQLSIKFSDTEHTKDQKEKKQQQQHNQLHICQQQTLEGQLKKQADVIERLHLQLNGAREEWKDASLQAKEQKETAAIFKQRYTAAIEKMHKVQAQVELLEEELRYSQQQLKESHLATHSMKREQAELERRYQQKVDQWESSQEALDHLADELQANQNLLTESEQKRDHFKSLIGSLQDQVDTLKQQKLTFECDLRLYQQSHSHSDEEYVSLLRDRQQLQKCCAEQVERIAECEKAILQMKSDLERQAQEKASLKQSLAASQHAHLSIHRQLENEVTQLKNKVSHSELELADTQKVRVALLRQSQEELKEAQQEAVRRSRELDVQRGEVQRLQEDLQKEEEKFQEAIREKRTQSTYIRQLRQELMELLSKHQMTVEDLAAHAEKARRMEGCLTEGKLAEEKIRSMAMKLEMKVAELKKNLQQAVNQKLKAEREKQDAHDQVETLQTELEGTRSDNAKLRHDNQLIMTSVSRWIAEQKDSNKSLTDQMKAQNKVLLIVTEEKARLQQANDTFKAEVKRLKEVAEKKERDMERFKAQIRDRGVWQDERPEGNQSCVALNLSKIEEMQTRLRSNLEAIGMLNQQLNALGGENKQLRRQLEEERSMRRQVEQLLLPASTSQHCSSCTHLLPLISLSPPPAEP